MSPFTSCFNICASDGRLDIPLKILKITTKDGDLNLVGNFLGLRSNIDTMREWAFHKWRTKAHFDIVALPNGFFLIKFFMDEDL